LYAFTYQRPTTVRQAASLLAKHEEAKLLAGGQLDPDHEIAPGRSPQIIDMSKIEGLGGIEVKGRSLVIGAMTPHAEVATSPLGSRPSGARSTRRPHRRSGRATTGHDRRLGRQQRSERRLSGRLPWARRHHRDATSGAFKADDFFKGLFETALESDEIITKVMFPAPKKAAYVKFPIRRRAMRWWRVRVKPAAPTSAWR